MKKRVTKYMVSLLTSAMVLTSLPVNLLTTQATELMEETLEEVDETVYLGGVDEYEGYFGANMGFYWSYNSNTATLTVTGQDDYLWHLTTEISDIARDNMKHIVFQDCVASGKLVNLLNGLSNVETVTFQNFNTANVTDMSSMFFGCSSLTSLDLSGFDTSNVTIMKSMFNGCSGLTSLDLSGFDTSNVTSMMAMFNDCSGLTSLNLNGFDTSNVMDMYSMFSGCSNLTTLDVNGFDTSKVTDMTCMFERCSGLTSLDVSKFDTSNVTDMRNMFTGCSGLVNLDVSKFDTSNVTNMGGMFLDCNSLTGLNVSNFNTSNVTNMSNLFAGCSNLTSLDVSKFDTSQTTDMSYMFFKCSSLTGLDLGSFDTSKVMSMSSMFSGCSSLKDLDVSSFATSKVMDMSQMFSDCSSLVDLDLSRFDTSVVTNMMNMFGNCSSLVDLNLSSFDTSKVTNMASMFSGCSNLLNLDVSGWDTSHVTDMYYMFSGCEKLESLDLSNFDFSQITFFEAEIIEGCKELSTLKTPKTLTKAQNMKLPYVMYDSQGNAVNKVTWEHCNKTLTKELVTYSIKFAGNGATSGKMSNLDDCKCNDSYTLTPNAFKRTGYTFTGWNTKANGTGTAYKNKATVSNLTTENGKTITLYAQWKKDSYKITYKLNGGKNNKSNPATYNVTSAITLKKPTQTGYTFAGWYSDSKYKNKITKISKGSTGKKILYAKWTPNKYTIKFNGNGSTSGKMKEMTSRKYGTSYKLTNNAFQKKGYKFTGWNTKKNGKGKAYKNKASVKNLVSANGKSITLYAQWKKK